MYRPATHFPFTVELIRVPREWNFQKGTFGSGVTKRSRKQTDRFNPSVETPKKKKKRKDTKKKDEESEGYKNNLTRKAPFERVIDITASGEESANERDEGETQNDYFHDYGNGGSDDDSTNSSTENKDDQKPQAKTNSKQGEGEVVATNTTIVQGQQDANQTRTTASDANQGLPMANLQEQTDLQEALLNSLQVPTVNPQQQLAFRIAILNGFQQAQTTLQQQQRTNAMIVESLVRLERGIGEGSNTTTPQNRDTSNEDNDEENTDKSKEKENK